MALTTPLDFVNNRIRITTDKYSENVLKSNIDYVEEKFGRMLLGSDLWDLFLADAGGAVPTSTRFQNIFQPFTKKSECGGVYSSDGMAKMFNYLTYFVHSNSLNQSITSQGNAKTTIETAEKGQNAYIIQIYNEGVQTYNAIQYYIMQNITDYPEFTGVKLDYIDNLFI